MTIFNRSILLQHRTLSLGILGSMSTICIFVLSLITFTASSWAQQVASTPPQEQAKPASSPASSVTPSKSSTSLKIQSSPVWTDLTQAQQISLAPLAAHWNTLEAAQKRKWIVIAANYPALAAAEQGKLHSRMTEWVSLSFEQRAQARLNFAQTKKLSSAEKTNTWQAYQALSPEEKQKLTTLPPQKLAGAAIATKPVPPQKLATVPVSHQSLIPQLKFATATKYINRNTLLPRTQLPIEPARKQNN